MKKSYKFLLAFLFTLILSTAVGVDARGAVLENETSKDANISAQQSVDFSTAEVTATPEPTVTPEPTATPKPTVSKKPVKNGLYYENGKYCYYKKGKKLKKVWKRVNGRVYYFKSNGAAATYSTKFGKKYFVFDQKGRRLNPKKNTIVKVGNNRYYVKPNGRALTGWVVVNHHLYYARSNGRCLANTTKDGITFGKDAKAKNGTSTQLKMKTMSIVSQITSSKMSKSQKLYQCWRYVVGGRFYYASKYPNIYQSGWQRSTALNMLTTRCGNCYSYACTFAALAKEIGYSPTVVCGRVPGGRDGAGDGYTRHAWVIINGAHYDPEAQYAGWAGGIYGRSYYPVAHQTIKYVKF